VRRLLALTIAVTALVPTAADAHQSPAGCFSNRLDVTIARDRTTIRPGQTLNYRVDIGNAGAGACDVTNVTTTFAVPGGLPTGLGTRDLAAGTAATTVGTPQWTAPDQPAGTAVATAKVSGVLHDAPVDHTAEVTKTIATDVVVPKLAVTVTPDPATGTAPQPVTFRYRVSNLSTPSGAVTNPVITHPACSPVVYAAGDTDGDTALDTNEQWDFTCTRSYTAAGVYTATAAVNATSTLDGGGIGAVSAPAAVDVKAPVSTAHLSLTKQASPVSGIAPLNVTYSYTVTNDGPSTPIKDVAVEDAACSPVTTTAGNADIAAGASRVFTCAASFGVGIFSSSAIATGIDTITGTRVNSAPASAEINVARAPDPQVTPVAVPDTPDATPTPTPTPKPSSQVKFSYTGRFTPARSCKGTVTLTLRAGTRNLATKRVKLDSRCRYKVSFTIARTRLGKATKVTITAKAGRRSASRTLAVPN
jgi:hypothetical protein